MPSKQRVVVVGNGMVGHHFVQQLVSQQGDNKNVDITVLSGEDRLAYDRVQLSSFFNGKTEDDLALTCSKTYQDWQVCFHTHSKVVDINRDAKKVTTAKGESFEYDKLILATGSFAFVPPIPGKDRDHCLVYRTINDLHAIKKSAQDSKVGVVIGGGLLGLEAAMGLSDRGMDVTVIHNNDIPLNRQLDQEAGELLKQALETRGLSFKMNAKTQSIVGHKHVEKVCFMDGSELDADLVVMAIGIRPNMKLAQDCGLYCQKGIVVSDTLQTYDPNIYALGECIEHRGDTFGLVAPLYEQAKVLANHLSEHGVAQFQSLPTATKLKVTGIHLFSVGNFLGTQHSKNIIYRHPQQGIYKKIVIENNQIIGVVLYGDTQEGPFYQELLEEQINIQQMRPYLMFGKALCETQTEKAA